MTCLDDTGNAVVAGSEPSQLLFNSLEKHVDSNIIIWKNCRGLHRRVQIFMSLITREEKKGTNSIIFDMEDKNVDFFLSTNQIVFFFKSIKDAASCRVVE